MEKQKVLSNGEVITKTEEGIYFLALREGFTPLLIDEEEGQKLLGE